MCMRGIRYRFVAVNAAAKRLRIVFVVVPCIFMIALLVLPALNGLILSFDHKGPSFANYRILFDDSMFWRALANNLLIPFGSVIFEFALGLALAMTGMHALPWLSPRSPLAMLTVIVVDAWHVTPIVMLMLMAGLQTIPDELYEAARLDGAGTFATFRFVTLPMLMPAIVGALILRGIDALRIFSTVLVLTGPEGVPVLSTYSYSLWDDAQKPHEAMAASMILALLVTIIGSSRLLFAARYSRATGAMA